LRGTSDDMLLTLVLAEVERRGLDPDAFGNRIARMGSEAARLMLRGSMALVAEIERREKLEAENAALREMQGLPPSGTYPKGELKRRMEARRAAMEGRTDDRF